MAGTKMWEEIPRIYWVLGTLRTPRTVSDKAAKVGRHTRQPPGWHAREKLRSKCQDP